MPEQKQKTYRMRTSAGTTGAVTGKNLVWRKGQVRVFPEGELAHLPTSHYEEVSAQALKATAPPAPETATAKPQRKSKSKKSS